MNGGGGADKKSFDEDWPQMKGVDSASMQLWTSVGAQ